MAEHEKLMDIDETLAHKFSGLCENIMAHGSALISFSGGTDSALLAFLGGRLLERQLCVILDSPLLSRSELENAEAFAQTHKLELRIIQHSELENPEFCANNRNRCYHCKTGLLGTLSGIMKDEGLKIILEGSNKDDLDDYRPGRKAIQENNVASPLLESGLSKTEIRTISRILGLETWDRPQMACMATRIPYGTPITEELLARIEKAEELVRNLGYRDVRVRYHGDIARIEVGHDEKIDMNALREIVTDIKKLRFKYVVLDMEGYRTGSMNEES